MKQKKYSRRLLCLLSGVIPLTLSINANANFYIDYQGLEKPQKKMSTEKTRQLKGSPDGYRILADKTHSVVHQVGKKRTVKKNNSFGTDMPLKDAITMIMPDKWIAYIDEQVVNPGKVDWQAKNDTWINILGKMGSNYGYRFVVDWDQKLLQISSDKDFTAPDYNDPIELTDPESGRSIFVYSAKPISKGGVILVDGKAIPVKIKN